jgi:hypothetical protein
MLWPPEKGQGRTAPNASRCHVIRTFALLLLLLLQNSAFNVCWYLQILHLNNLMTTTVHISKTCKLGSNRFARENAASSSRRWNDNIKVNLRDIYYVDWGGRGVVNTSLKFRDYIKNGNVLTDCATGSLLNRACSLFLIRTPELSDSTYIYGTALQVGRSRDRFPASPEFFPWHLTVPCALGSTQPLKMSTRSILGVKAAGA